jgi:hypothetical protein
LCGLAQPGFNELAQSELQTTVKCSTTFHVSSSRSCARFLSPLSLPRCVCARFLALYITPIAGLCACELVPGVACPLRGWERETVPRVFTRHEHVGHSPAVKHADQPLGLRTLVLRRLPRRFHAHPTPPCCRPFDSMKCVYYCSTCYKAVRVGGTMEDITRYHSNRGVSFSFREFATREDYLRV